MAEALSVQAYQGGRDTTFARRYTFLYSLYFSTEPRCRIRPKSTASMPLPVLIGNEEGLEELEMVLDNGLGNNSGSYGTVGLRVLLNTASGLLFPINSLRRPRCAIPYRHSHRR